MFNEKHEEKLLFSGCDERMKTQEILIPAQGGSLFYFTAN